MTNQGAEILAGACTHRGEAETDHLAGAHIPVRIEIEHHIVDVACETDDLPPFWIDPARKMRSAASLSARSFGLRRSDAGHSLPLHVIEILVELPVGDVMINL